MKSYFILFILLGNYIFAAIRLPLSGALAALPRAPSVKSAKSCRAVRSLTAANLTSNKRGSRASRLRQQGPTNPRSLLTAAVTSDSSLPRQSSADDSSRGSSRGTGFDGGTSYTYRLLLCKTLIDNMMKCNFKS